MLRVEKEKMESFLKDLFIHMGLEEKHSKTSAQVIIQADMTGVPTHGIAKVPYYAMRYKNEAVNKKPDIRQLNEGLNQILLDGDNGSGLVVGPRALELCINLAKDNGMASVAVKNSSHYGCGNYYGWKLAEAGLIGIVFTNTAPLMAPFGGKERSLGTNPITIAVPSKERFPIVLDMATSMAAYGKIQIAAAADETIPKDWANDSEGVPTNDPQMALDGTLQAFGGHKGYGLAVIVEAFTALLTGSPFGGRITTMEELAGKKEEAISHFFMAIDPKGFSSGFDFYSYVDSYIDYIKNTEKAKGVEEIYLPGELEFRRFEEATAKGVSIRDEQLDRLLVLAKELNLCPDSTVSIIDFINSKY
ncbi:MAG: Ldh family oxidoreductase [Synergistaceae bacterium]|nr:Ldh family oxidoreductase [Synergistaceae bacterium]